MELSGSRSLLAISLWAVLACSCVANAASTSAKEVVAFDSALLNRTVEPAGDTRGVAGSIQAGPDGVVAGVIRATDSAAFDPGVLLSTLSESSTADSGVDAAQGAKGFLDMEPRFGMKRFLLAVILLGGLIRYLTSAAYKKLMSDVLDPLNW